MNNILLNSKKSVYSRNEKNTLNIQLENNTDILPMLNVDKRLSMNEQYIKERDECGRFRIIATLNPIFSNLLFNTVTEPMINEGSSACTSLIYSSLTRSEYAVRSLNETPIIDRMQCIRDTEYSDKDITGIVYHCGIDIFNNHILRSKSFNHSKKISNNKTVFNTIKDFKINLKNTIEKEDTTTGSTIKPNFTNIHIYNDDNIYSMNEAFNERLEEVDGWYGFYNLSNINIKNNTEKTSDGNDIYVNRVINNNKGCELIDMYPDRSLYSFIPKLNGKRNRVEYNWDFFLVYPYKNDYDKLNEISAITENGAVVVSICESEYSNNGTELLVLKSKFKHNLSVNDTVRLYYESGTNITQAQFKVIDVGTYDEPSDMHYFKVRKEDALNLFGELLNNAKLSYKRIVDTIECKYYIRKFKKIDNISYDINKLAYGKNIYGDRIAEIIFTDDIVLNDMKDNLGRDITDIYLGIVKTNRGNKEWYEDGNTTGDTIEFSHCFSKVTSGFDLGYDSASTDYNVRCMHNVDFSKVPTEYSAATLAIFNDFRHYTPKPIEDNITTDMDEFYGDIVEYIPTMCEEITLDGIYYRFNTAQRETLNSKYFDIIEDKLVHDDYDFPYEGDSSYTAFTVVERYVNEINNYGKFAGNLSLEGYWYKPFNKITLRKFANTLSTNTCSYVNLSSDEYRNTQFSKTSLSSTTWIMTVKTLNAYKTDNVEFCCFYDNTANETIGFGNFLSYSKSSSGNQYEIKIILTESDYNKIYNVWSEGKYKMILINGYCPEYAKYDINTNKMKWKTLLKPSQYTSTDALYNMPFSNGCLYSHSNMNIFLRRQDPDGKYGLSYPKSVEGVVSPMIKYSTPTSGSLDLSGILYTLQEINNTCV